MRERTKVREVDTSTEMNSNGKEHLAITHEFLTDSKPQQANQTEWALHQSIELATASESV